jgi:hypothetical protein
VKVAGSTSDEVNDFFFNLPNPSARTMALGLTQLLTEMSTSNKRKFLGSKAWSVRRADNLTAVRELIV